MDDDADLPPGRLAALERLVSGLGAEVRTERLVVVDAAGGERIEAQVEGSTAVLRVGLGDAEEDGRASAVLYAHDDPDLGPGVGVQLWAAGDSVFEINATSEPGGRRWRVVLHGPGYLLTSDDDEPVAATG